MESITLKNQRIRFLRLIKETQMHPQNQFFNSQKMGSSLLSIHPQGKQSVGLDAIIIASVLVAKENKNHVVALFGSIKSNSLNIYLL